MVSTRLQCNNSTNDNSMLSSSDVLPKLSGIAANVERTSRVTSNRLPSNSNSNDNAILPSSETLQKWSSSTPNTERASRITSTRQSNNNADNLMLPPPSEVTQKCSCFIGCMTRSVASTHPNTCHSKDPVQSKVAIYLMDLPTEIIEKIVSMCGYKTAANLRLVNREMNHICGSLLTLTFNKLQNSMLSRFHNIKAQMPRRESARRQHALACEFDIVETIYMRLNLLHMTFGKHIEKKMMYFFPGEVLDEVYRIIHLIKVTPKLPRPYLVTDELFDLTTMAMEYFKEKLEPNLPEITYYGRDRMNYSPIRCSPSAVASNSIIRFDETSSVRDYSLQSLIEEDPPQSNMVLRKRIRKIKQGMRIYNSQLTTIKRELKGYKMKMADQQKTILDYATRLDENDKKNEEISRKYSTLLQELNKCKTELQYWRSVSPLNPTPVCGTCGTLNVPLPVEEIEVLHNQGVVIPLAVKSPLIEEEPSDEKIKTEELSSKEIRNNMCSLEEDGDVVDDSTTPKSTEDQNEHPASSTTSNIDFNIIDEDDNDSTNSNERPLRPAKRKQIMEKTSYKKCRSILKLRSKTIRK